MLAAPTVDISNMSTANLKPSDNIEVYKQKTLISCQNMFTVAQDALRSNPNINKVILMEHAPRLDTKANDPTGLKRKLAQYANTSLAQMWECSSMKENIVIGKHTLHIDPEYQDTN